MEHIKFELDEDLLLLIINLLSLKFYNLFSTTILISYNPK
jgi:hypothetical protein